MVLACELESPERPGGPRQDATVMSFDPGVVDTAAQAAVRASTIETLPIVDMFKQLAADGLLAPPEGPAEAIADYLEGDEHPRFSEQNFGPNPPA
jgi:hypothetical protein